MASRNGDSVWMDGQDRLYANFNRCIEEVGRQAKKGLEKAGMKIIADAQRNLRTAGHNGGAVNATGRLSQSGKVQGVENDPMAVDIGFFSDESGSGYAAYVENGTRAHWPPTAAISAWVSGKLHISATSRPKENASVTYLVKRKIARRGTPPRKFFGPAVSKNKAAVTRVISDAIKTVTKKDM